MDWISIHTELPYPYEYCLVCGKCSNSGFTLISIGRQYDGVWEMMSTQEQSNATCKGDLTWFMNGDEITHWMPLPKSPED